MLTCAGIAFLALSSSKAFSQVTYRLDITLTADDPQLQMGEQTTVRMWTKLSPGGLKDPIVNGGVMAAGDSGILAAIPGSQAANPGFTYLAAGVPAPNGGWSFGGSADTAPFLGNGVVEELMHYQVQATAVGTVSLTPRMIYNLYHFPEDDFIQQFVGTTITVTPEPASLLLLGLGALGLVRLTRR